MAEKLKGKKLNFNDSDNKKDVILENKEIVFDKMDNVDLSENTFKVKTRRIKKPRRKGISFTQVLNVSEIKKASEKVAEKEKIKIKGKKIKEKVIDEKEKVIDNELENEETMSIAVILFILIVCFVIGIVLGYLLYHIAINSSNALLIVQKFLF
mgnify:FL=1